jgi:hypothetical protein
MNVKMSSSSTFHLAQFTRTFYETRPQPKLFTVESVVDHDDEVAKALRDINDRLDRIEKNLKDTRDMVARNIAAKSCEKLAL